MFQVAAVERLQAFDLLEGRGDDPRIAVEDALGQGAKDVRLGGLWKNKSRDGGTTYLAGSFGAARLLIFPNDRKQGERDPDYVVYVVPAGKRKGD